MALENTDKKVEDLTFKEASVELERVVRQLEGGDLELEDALERYARGVELLRSLRERLNNAEQKVQVLLDSTSEVAVISVFTRSKRDGTTVYGEYTTCFGLGRHGLRSTKYSEAVQRVTEECTVSKSVRRCNSGSTNSTRHSGFDVG